MRFSIPISFHIISSKTAAIGSSEPPSQCGSQLCCDLEISLQIYLPRHRRKLTASLEEKYLGYCIWDKERGLVVKKIKKSEMKKERYTYKVM